MPELPEVEIIRRQLKKAIVGKRIKNVEIKLPKILKTPFKEFKKAVFGSKIKTIIRRAKLLIINFSSGYSLLIHLKMTGQLIFAGSLASIMEAKLPFGKHTHLVFNFSDKSRLLFNDLRQFGYVKLNKTNRVGELLQKNYGPEPLEKNFTFPLFKRILAKKPRLKIKQLLMDQKNIAGIGNLYADEILFYAGVLPMRINSSLNNEEIKKIYTGIKKILTDAIKYRGSSVENYLDARGREGEYHLRLKAYARAGQDCKKCGGKIQKIKLAGRGTHFCPECQK